MWVTFEMRLEQWEFASTENYVNTKKETKDLTFVYPSKSQLCQKAHQILIAFLGLIQLWQVQHICQQKAYTDCRGSRNPQITQNKHFGAKIWNRSRASMTECTDLFTAFAPARSPPANVSITSGCPRGILRGLEKVHKQCQSSSSTRGESSPVCTSAWGPVVKRTIWNWPRAPSAREQHCQGRPIAKLSVPLLTCKPKTNPQPGHFYLQLQLHDRLCNTLGKYWLGSNRQKIFGLHQMWCVRIFETLAKGVIWENKNCRWMCLLCKVVRIVPRCQKCAWRFHPQEEGQL